MKAGREGGPVRGHVTRLLQSGRANVIQLRKCALEIRITFGFYSGLRGAPSERRPFSISAVEAVHHVHTFDDSPEWREAFAIEPRRVGEIDENLGGAGVGSIGSERYGPAPVTFSDRVVRNLGVTPSFGNCWISIDAELDDKSGNYTKKSRAVVKMRFAQGIEPVCSERRCAPRYLQREIAFGCFESDMIRIRRALCASDIVLA